MVLDCVQNATNGQNAEKAMVLYMSLETGDLWVRDFDEFYGQVQLRDKLVPRFRKVEDG
jgi:hypothetical protein